MHDQSNMDMHMPHNIRHSLKECPCRPNSILAMFACVPLLLLFLFLFLFLFLLFLLLLLVCCCCCCCCTSYGTLLILYELLLDESQHQRGLTHSYTHTAHAHAHVAHQANTQQQTPRAAYHIATTASQHITITSHASTSHDTTSHGIPASHPSTSVCKSCLSGLEIEMPTPYV